MIFSLKIFSLIFENSFRLVQSSHTPHSLPYYSPLVTSDVSVVHLLQLINHTDTLLLSKVHTLFRCPTFLPNILFLFKNPI